MFLTTLVTASGGVTHLTLPADFGPLATISPLSSLPLTDSSNLTLGRFCGSNSFCKEIQHYIKVIEADGKTLYTGLASMVSASAGGWLCCSWTCWF